MTAAPVAPPAVRPYRILVAGSRSWRDGAVVAAALTEAVAEGASSGRRVVIVHGGCPSGADVLADLWARTWGVAVEDHPAEWPKRGRSADPLRNRMMVAAGADLCLAFIRDNSPGASHCARLAEAAGIPVRRFS